MKYRTLGQADLKLSEIGLGTVKIGRNQQMKYPNHYQLPKDQDVIRLLETAQELGINTIDTAASYGKSEERLGQLLPGPRDSWIIISKAGEQFQETSEYKFDKESIFSSVANSLKKLRTDYLDILLVHSDGRDEEIIEQYDLFHTLSELKKRGDIRYGGISTKTVAGGLLTLAHSDCAMVTYNPIYTDEEIVIKKAAELKKGILLKKVFASGHLNKIDSTDPIKTCLELGLSQAGVTSIIMGTLSPEHLISNLKTIGLA